MTTHTPGPWRAIVGPGSIVRIVGPAPHNAQVGETYHENREADARLIASAPQLLADNARLRDALTGSETWLAVLYSRMCDDSSAHPQAVANLSEHMLAVRATLAATKPSGGA